MEKAVDLLKSLVNIPSSSGNEEEILIFLEKWFIEKQFDFVIRKETFVAGQIKAKGKKEQKKEAIILTGHVDTVVSGHLADWKFSPTDARVEEGKLFGLGASDMKGGDVGNLLAAASFIGKDLSQDIWVVGTANEELDGKGSEDFARYFSENWSYDSACCIIAEPTDLEKIYIGQRGNHFMKLHFSGKAGHASVQEHFQQSALGAVTYFLENIEQIVEDLKIYKNSQLGLPTFVVTSILSGDENSPNKTADFAELVVDCRLTPELEEVFEQVMSELAVQYHFTYEDIVTPVLSTLTDNQAPFIQLLTDLSGAKTTAASGSNDQGFLKMLGLERLFLDQDSMNNATLQMNLLFLKSWKNILKFYNPLLKKCRRVKIFTDKSCI